MAMSNGSWSKACAEEAIGCVMLAATRSRPRSSEDDGDAYRLAALDLWCAVSAKL